jgi:hypothetical protein
MDRQSHGIKETRALCSFLAYLAISHDGSTENLKALAGRQDTLEFVASQKVSPAEPDSDQLRTKLRQHGVEEEILAVKVVPALDMEFLNLTSSLQEALPEFNRVVVPWCRLAS